MHGGICYGVSLEYHCFDSVLGFVLAFALLPKFEFKNMVVVVLVVSFVRFSSVYITISWI